MFRRVLGPPTGASVITAMGADGKPAGMAVGSIFKRLAENRSG
jgi:flavin reductase (DIM6/NTAB) family NADH-FMN oxidoreductase RutF